MKFFVSFLLMMVLSFAACLYFPWWSIAIVAFVVSALIHQRAARAFLTGYCALQVLWSALALYISGNNQGLFSHKISLLILKIDNPLLLIILTGLIGGLVAGFGSITGSYFRRLIGSKSTNQESQL